MKTFSAEPYRNNIAGGARAMRFAIIGVAAAAAIGAALTAGMLASGGGEKTVVTQAPQIEMAEVLVASGDIKAGGRTDAASFKWQKWLRSSITGNMITKQGMPDAIEKYNNAFARVAITYGEPIMAAKLVAGHAGGYLSAMLPHGMRAVSISISPETGAGGFILPNDRVDVIQTRKEAMHDSGNKVAVASETVLRNVQILAIDQTAEKQNKEDEKSVAVGKTATLALRPDQAERLARYNAMGELSLALRSYADSQDGMGDENESQQRIVVVHRAGANSFTTVRHSVPLDASVRFAAKKAPARIVAGGHDEPETTGAIIFKAAAN